MSNLGLRLKKARENKRLTQQQVAEILGISNGTISGYERNYRDPDTEILKKMANLYEVSLDWLHDRNEKESEYSLPENKINHIIREVEEEYKVNLSDDPVVQETIRTIIESLAKKMSQDKKN
ncbi:helix-turn-helix domain-containing protein [Paenibacillus chitinolyticus]|uniref:helix-turn-helix domain-containing protein n=1 Tax=Paenibacillus chitinolyticus TaxID=79263 RepID=UPI0036DF2494